MRDPILGAVWHAAGFKGKPPPVYLDRGLRDEMGMQAWNDRRVWLNPTIAKQIRSAPLHPAAVQDALKVLLHEYAHVNQPRVYPAPRFEPAAEAWAHGALDKVMDMLGAGPTRPKYSWPAVTYGAWMNLQNRKMGGPQWERFIQRGQFGRR